MILIILFLLTDVIDILKPDNFYIDVIASELNKNFLLELISIFILISFLINLRKIIKYEKKSTCCMER